MSTGSRSKKPDQKPKHGAGYRFRLNRRREIVSITPLGEFLSKGSEIKNFLNSGQIKVACLMIELPPEKGLPSIVVFEKPPSSCRRSPQERKGHILGAFESEGYYPDLDKLTTSDPDRHGRFRLTTSKNRAYLTEISPR